MKPLIYSIGSAEEIAAMVRRMEKRGQLSRPEPLTRAQVEKVFNKLRNDGRGRK
jgi:hypothetical protein